MYIHLGEEVLIKSSSVVGIFDLEKTTTQKITKDFLVSKNFDVVTVSYEMPKSFVVCVDDSNKTTVYISQISPATLKKRSQSKIWR